MPGCRFFAGWDWLPLPFLWLLMETSQVLHLVKIATLKALLVPSMLFVSIQEDIAPAAGTTFQSPNSHSAPPLSSTHCSRLSLPLNDNILSQEEMFVCDFYLTGLRGS